MKTFFSRLVQVIKKTFQAYSEDKVPRLGAALAYYAAFSLAPMLLIAAAVAGFIFGPEAAQGEIIGQFRSLLGENGAQLVQTMLEQAYQPAKGVLATVVGLGSLALGATGVFNQLQQAMNVIWGVPRKKSAGIWGMVRDRLLSMTMVVATGFLLITSLLISALLAGLDRYLRTWVGPGAAVYLSAFNIILSVVILGLVFSLLFKLLPDARVRWSDVWLGGLLTAVLFTVGKYLIGLYLGNASVGSTYGSAGSLAVLLVWVYYSSQIFFLGAEFTNVYADRFLNDEIPRIEPPIGEEAAPDREKASALSPKPSPAETPPPLSQRPQLQAEASTRPEKASPAAAYWGLVVLAFTVYFFIRGRLGRSGRRSV